MTPPPKVKRKVKALEERLKEHLLANFCDGDSWEDADSLHLTKHGVLEVAKYFYKLPKRKRGKDEQH